MIYLIYRLNGVPDYKLFKNSRLLGKKGDQLFQVDIVTVQHH